MRGSFTIFGYTLIWGLDKEVPVEDEAEAETEAPVAPVTPIRDVYITSNIERSEQEDADQMPLQHLPFGFVNPSTAPRDPHTSTRLRR